MHGSVLQSIGNTPLVELTKLTKARNLKARIFAKLESANPFGSVKDRAALWMVAAAERDGILRPGSVIVEPTSGNTGIGLAGVGAAKGYRVILTMPETMTEERRQLLRAHGAELELTPGKEGMPGAIRRAKELVQTLDSAFMPDQFSNPANALAHYEGTGPEIWRGLDGAVSAFVAGIGTGGTITGVGRYLKEYNPDTTIIGVEPQESPVLQKGAPGPHGIQGIGAGFIPTLLDQSILDEIIGIKTEEAKQTARTIAAHEGILIGVSGGAAITAATTLATRPEYEGKNIITLLPDSGERYLSTGLFQDLEGVL